MVFLTRTEPAIDDLDEVDDGFSKVHLAHCNFLGFEALFIGTLRRVRGGLGGLNAHNPPTPPTPLGSEALWQLRQGP